MAKRRGPLTASLKGYVVDRSGLSMVEEDGMVEGNGDAVLLRAVL